jgi:hypothetical protein
MLPLESLAPLMRVTLILVGQRAWLILLEAGSLLRGELQEL